MKRPIIFLLLIGILIAGLFFVLSTNKVAAQAVCGGAGTNALIMRLSGNTNAHGEIYNGAGNYGTEICFNSLFPSVTVPTNPDRTCAGGNQERVLRLSGNTNAHGETPDNPSPLYTTNVCYQGLSCISRTGNCNSGETKVLGLSGATNAHLEIGSQNNYGTSICCTASAPPSQGFSNLQWRDFANNQIPETNTNPICVGRWVKTYSAVGGITGNVEFDIYENDLINNDFIRTVTGTINANGNVDANWEITQADYNAGRDIVLGVFVENRELEFYFIASQPSPGTITSGNSYDLWPVTDDPSACNYLPPTGGITGPTHQGIYFVNDPIQFINDCSSPYGPLTYSWTIRQSGSEIQTSNLNTFTFTYSSAQRGQSEISLTCTDIRGQSVTSQVGIVVAASPEVLVYIEDPAMWGIEYTTPPASGPYFPNEVSFSSTDSFAVLIFGLTGLNEPFFNCVGYCLSATNGICPHSLSQGKILACIGRPLVTPEGKIPILTTENFNNFVLMPGGAPPLPIGHSTLNFDWEFWDNDWIYQGNAHQGNGYTSGFIEYDDRSEQFDDKHAKVTVASNSEINAVVGAYNTITGSSYSTPIGHEFTRDFTLGRCLNGGNEFISRPANHQTQNTGEENNACKGGDSIAGTADDCCTSGLFCLDNDGDTFYKCDLLNGVVVTRCEDFSTQNFGNNAQNLCNGNNNSQIAQTSYGQQVGVCEYVKCVWNTNTNTCGVQLFQYPTTPNGQCNTNPTGCTPAQCSWSISSTECINGQQTITRTPTAPTPGGLPLCTPASGNNINCATPTVVTVPCGNLGFELPFFDYIQFIASALIIALIYAALLAGRNKR